MPSVTIETELFQLSSFIRLIRNWLSAYVLSRITINALRLTNIMPRQPRLDAPGLLQHVMARGIERKEIFKDDEDRSDFLDRLAYILEETL